MTIKQYLLAAIGCFALTSCVEVEMNGEIDDKGSGKVTLITESPAGNPLDKDAKLPTQEKLDEQAKTKLAEEQPKAKATGVQVTDVTMTLKGDKKIEKSVIKFETLKQLNAFLNYKEPGAENKDEPVTTVSINEKDGAKVFKFKMEMPKQENANPQQEAMIAGILGDSKLTMVWTLPGEISKVSGEGKISDSQKTATWTTPLINLFKKGVNFEANFK